MEAIDIFFFDIKDATSLIWRCMKERVSDNRVEASVASILDRRTRVLDGLRRKA